MKKFFILFCSAALCLLFLPLLHNTIDAAWLRYFATPESVLQRFYTERDLAEDQLQDALILAGSKMVPLLEREVLKKDIPRRRYAISALSTVGNAASIPVFEQILRDKGEEFYFRVDALEGIVQLDLAYAQRIAPEFMQDEPYVAKCAQMVLTSPERIYNERTYGDAFVHRHD